MAAGALGVVTALLVYSLLFNFLSPINLSFFADHFNNHSLFNRYEKTFVNNADWLVKQTYNALGNFRHGKHTLAVTFIYPSLYKRVKIHSKSSTRRHQSKALGLIIMICLLLSGDIHPCPGPHHAKPVNVLDFTSDSAVSQVRTLGRGTLLSGYVQQTNLPCFGSPGFGGGVLPAWSAVTSGEVVEAQRLGTSIMDRRHTGPVDSMSDPAILQVRTFGGGRSRWMLVLVRGASRQRRPSCRVFPRPQLAFRGVSMWDCWRLRQAWVPVRRAGVTRTFRRDRALQDLWGMKGILLRWSHQIVQFLWTLV